MIARGPGEERKERSIEDGSCCRQESGREAGRSSLGIGRWQKGTQEAEEEGISRDSWKSRDRGGALGFSEEVIMGQEREPGSQMAGS